MALVLQTQIIAQNVLEQNPVERESTLVQIQRKHRRFHQYQEEKMEIILTFIPLQIILI